MDSSVIVLDSSDDEKEPNAKKSAKKTQQKMNSSGKCVIGHRVLVSNKHITIEKSHTKLPAINRSKPSVTKMKPVHSVVVVPSVLPPFQKNNNDPSAGKSVRVQQINTSEITIVPIQNSKSPPSNRPSSPKITNAADSIEISSILVPKTTPPKSSSGISSTSPPSSSASSVIAIKRITPLTVSSVVTKRIINNDSDAQSKDSFGTNDDHAASDSGTNDRQPPKKRMKMEKTPLNEAFTELLDACRMADPTDDMEHLINRKLIRYYQSVHPEFVNSKSFRRNALAVAAEIRAQPKLAYLKLVDIIEELDIRRKSGESGTINNEDEVSSTGDGRKDSQIRKLNNALIKLKKKIAVLDEAEVDWDNEDNSTFMILERYKKRAWQIFEKICKITGEDTSAQRLVRKPIKFRGTKYHQFNRMLQAFVNEKRLFPDMFDVLRLLDHCNEHHNYGMTKDEIKAIAQDAFLQIGEALQKRRKTDLYETASYFTGTLRDPALEDTELATKLSENQKYHDRIKELIEKFSSQQNPCQNDVNSSGGDALTKSLNVSDDIIDLDTSLNSSNNEDTKKRPDKSDRTTTFDGSHNLNNNSAPMLTIVSVTSLQPGDPLLENKDESKIIISDDEEL